MRVKGSNNPARAVVMVSGGGTNLQAVINQIQSGELALDIAAVISDRPDILGLERASKAGLPTLTIDYAQHSSRDLAERALTQTLQEIEPDLVVLAGFMRILPADLVENFRGRMLNIHPSLLPKYRGLHTYRRAIDAGDAQHGSTVHFVTPELDAGPSIIQYRVPIRADETETSLASRVQHGEYQIYPQAIGWLADRRLRLIEDEVWLDGLPLEEPVVIDEPAAP